MKNYEIEEFGHTKSGEQAYLYTYRSDSGMEIKVTDYGASLVSLLVPDAQGNMRDVVLGFDSVSGYERQFQCLGAVIGRTCNRIEHACFTLNEKKYKLSKNFGKHNIHGGHRGFHKRFWKYAEIPGGMEFTYLSRDGEEGYPGNLTIAVRYIIENGTTLKLEYSGQSDQDTICNITNHSYFNLAGHESGSAEQQWIQIFADYYTESDKGGFPNGNLMPVQGTPMDFRRPKRIAEDINSDFPQIRWYQGYDSNFAIRDYDGKDIPKPVACAYDEESGIEMLVTSTMPGVQFYTGNCLNGCEGKSHRIMQNHDGYCFETQYFPNAMAHKNFVPPILRRGETYHHITTYGFSVHRTQDKPM